MKKLTIVILTLLFTGIVWLAIEGNKVHEIKTEVVIAAPPAAVWTVITDIDKWQEWSPIIKASHGDVSIGSTLDITMVGKEAGKDGPQYTPVITALDVPTYFRWRAHMLAGFIMTNDKIIKLEAVDGGTRVTHIETFSGLLAPIFSNRMEAGVPPMLNAMNEALKASLERE